MARYGWSYLLVKRTAERTLESYDGGRFSDEQSMLDELGAVGWELVAVREEEGLVRYYFKRPRA
jgi:hypothetical protein